MIPSETVQAAQRLLAERERFGLAKYGTTVDRTDLQAGDWLQHAIEEASDLLLYLIRLQQMMPRTPDSERSTLSSLAGIAPDLMPLEEQPAPAAAPERRKAPWPDYAGNPIFEGDVIVHPDGSKGRVIFDESKRPSAFGHTEWRCDYGDGQPTFALCLQIGPRGMAVVEKPAADPADAERRFGPITSDPGDAERNIRAKEDAERAAYEARWKDAPADATHLAQDSDGVCWFYESEPILDSDQNWFGALALRAVADNLLGSVKCEPRPVQGVGP